MIAAWTRSSRRRHLLTDFANAEDCIANLKICDAFADSADHAGNISYQSKWKLRFLYSPTHLPIGAVDAGGHHIDDHLARPGDGVRQSPYFKTSGPPYCSMKAAFIVFLPLRFGADGLIARRGVRRMYTEPAIRQWPHLEGFCNGASLMTSPRGVPIFDGHNDVLLRLYRRAARTRPGRSSKERPRAS